MGAKLRAELLVVGLVVHVLAFIGGILRLLIARE